MPLYRLNTFVWKKLLIISNDFFSEASWPVMLKFHVEPPLGRVKKDCLNDCGPLTKMAVMPIYAKTFKNLLLQNQISPGPNLCTNYQVQKVYQNC